MLRNTLKDFVFAAVQQMLVPLFRRVHQQGDHALFQSNSKIFCQQSQNDGGMFYFEVQGNRLDAKWVRRDSVVADQFTIIKGAKNNTTDSVTIYKGESATLYAGWPGTYFWTADSSTKSSLIAAPNTTTTYVVRDSAGHPASPIPLPLRYWIRQVQTQQASRLPVQNLALLSIRFLQRMSCTWSLPMLRMAATALLFMMKQAAVSATSANIWTAVSSVWTLTCAEFPANKLLLLEVDNGAMKQELQVYPE